MELTKLTHTLTIGGIAHVIDEPIGFDGLKTKISRGTYHGVSAEVSVGKLEFYDNAGRNAASIIRNAYNTDIDTEIAYTVTDESGEVLYSGIIDLSTYSETNAQATKVSVNVGEIGIKTTFNNRSETEVDLNRADTIDGATLAHDPVWKHLRIPEKTILYTNEMTARTDVIWDESTAPSGRFSLGDEKSHQWINLCITGVNQLEEIGECNVFPDIAAEIGADNNYIGDKLIGEYYQPFFEKGAGWAEKYGTNTKYSIHIKAEIKIEGLGDFFTNSPVSGIQEYSCCLALIDGNASFGRAYADFKPIRQTEQWTFTNSSKTKTVSVDWELTDCDYQHLYLGVFMRSRNFYADNVLIYTCYNNPTQMKVTVSKDSFIKMYAQSKYNEVQVSADMLMTHEALNKIVECISENQLHVVSSLYGRPDSVYPTTAMGAGALKAITNGYKIRGLFTDDENKRNMPLSFKNIIEALDAIDCIGWGFIEENGALVVRVENWAWFYKNDVILTINEPNEKSRSVNNDHFITQLTIGYKKYTTNEDINSIDSIHSERVFNTGVKAVTKELSKLCTFIADNYSIETTRRKAIENTTDEFKYDENIFVFELRRTHITQGYVYYVASNIVQNSPAPEGITEPKELFNAALSPRRMAERWKQRMAFANSQRAFELTKGTVNYKAAFATKQSTGTTDYLDTVSGKLAEDATIENGAPLMKAETLKVKFPISLNQYKAIKANPYGLIVVDGEKCWLKEMQYEFKTGTAEFTLIPKYEQ